jgi:ribosomal-protein-alanine N-acetyltransferase
MSGYRTDAGMHVRRMRTDDLERVMELAAGLRDAPHWPAAAWGAALHAEGAVRRIALVAEDGASGETAGFAVASVVAGTAELEGIAVEAGRQQRGAGGALFRALAAELKEAGAGEMVLEVRASNRPGRGFYQALGFAETGRRAGYYAEPAEDAVLMALELEKTGPGAG